MAKRVLIVDDSRFFQRRVKEMLDEDPRLEVVGLAENGEEAIKLFKELNPDVITMDIEMPVMDGITAVRNIMSIRPVPIIMFSSLTTDGAKATLDALDAGAVDFLPKKFDEIADDKNLAKKRLCDKVAIVASKPLYQVPVVKPATAPSTKTKVKSAPAPQLNRAPVKSNKNVKLVVIGTSTGGPVALQQVLSKLPASFPLPIVLVQHMPGSFTPAFAKRLDSLCSISVKEAENGDLLEPGHAYLAPGSMQMLIEKNSSNGGGKLVVKENDSQQFYNPCVDVTLKSADLAFTGEILVVILTGMGSDGCESSKLLKKNGCEIWAQDEQSCVVFGMPGAIIEEGLADSIYPLTEIGSILARKFS